MQQLMERLTRLEQEAAEIRAKIEAQPVAPVAPVAPSLLTKPVPGSETQYFGLMGSGTTPLYDYGYTAVNAHARAYQHGSIFQTEALAKAYAEAFETFLLLRHQPGTVPARNEEPQWLIELNTSGGLMLDYYYNMHNKLAGLCPCFSSEEFALAAIDTLGAERILRMFKTFHHVEG